MKHSEILRLVAVKLLSQRQLIQSDLSESLHDVCPIVAGELFNRADELDAQEPNKTEKIQKLKKLNKPKKKK